MNQTFAVIRKAPLSGLILGFWLFIFSGLVYAQDAPEIDGPSPATIQDEAIRALFKNPKMLNPDAVLEDFMDGKSTTRVIVNLQKPANANSLRDFRNMEVRQQLREAVSRSQDRLINTLNPLEVRVTNRFTYIFGFSAEVTIEGLQQLTDNPGVLSIEKDEIIHAQTAQGIPLMQASTPRATYNGAGLSIAICDTGIDYTHPMLGGGGFPNTKVIGGYDCGDDDNDPMDLQGHGTACSGIAAGTLGNVGSYIGGVAYNARLYALKISHGSGGSAYLADMIEAWEWCITHQNDSPNNPIMIISTSFGGGRYYSTCDDASPSRTQAAANAVAAGMTMFVSAGNEGYCDSMGAPACISHVISVGAVYDANLGRNPPSGYVGCISNGSCVGTPGPPCDEKYYVDNPANADQVTTYSNSASFLGLLAPSNWAYTTKLGGGYWDTANGFGGTSAACPYAAGAAACLQSAAKALTGSYLTPAQVRSTLMSTGNLITDGKVSITKPRINLQQAVNSLPGSSAAYVDISGSCGGKSPCYTTIQGAINAEATGATIKITGGTYNENVTLNSPKTLDLKGGYNSAFTSQSSMTIINSLSILNGKIIPDHFILYPAGPTTTTTTTTTTIPAGSRVTFCLEAACSSVVVTLGTITHPNVLNCNTNVIFGGIPAGTYAAYASGCGLTFSGSITVDGSSSYLVWLCPPAGWGCCATGCGGGGAYNCGTCQSP